MTERREVPCGNCQACCRRERVVLATGFGDDPNKYWCDVELINDSPQYVLAHKPNGDCVYLTPKGCAIHDHAPYACQQFDCRRWINAVPEAMAELLKPDDLEGHIQRAAKARLSAS
jgi:Fe-S-cluster containining protein